MRLTVLGGAGAYPPARGACSGYLLEHDGFRLLIDPGYAVVPRLLERLPAEAIDAVLVTHGHPDHVADLDPLLRARAMRPDPPPPLRAYALPGALDPVLALDSATSLDGACDVRAIEAGASLSIGPFDVATRSLPHFVPNVGVRIAAGSVSVTYTGDAGPTHALVDLAVATDLLIAEATYVDAVPAASAGNLNDAAEAGRQARAARAGRLMLTHLWPGTDPGASLAAAQRAFGDRIDVATAGLVVALD